MPKHIPAPDTPAHRLATFQSIVDDSAVARDASGKALETGAFRSAFWFKDFRRPLGWSPAPGVTTSWELFLRGVNLPGPGVSVGSDKPYLGVREPHRTGPYSKWISYGEAKSISEACGAAIIGLCGLKPQVPGQVWNNDQSTIEEITGDKIAFYTPNCPQWRLADLACTAYDFVSVPLFPNTDPVGIKHMFTLCKIRLVFCHLDQLQKVEAVESPFLNYIVVIPSRDGSGLVTSAISDSFKSRNPHIKGIWNWDEFVDYGRKNPVPVSPATHPDEILTICFTSGSTGLPKGAMISHRNMLAESSVWIESAPKESGEQFSPSDTFLSYSPLAHQAERCMYSALTCQGVAIGMSSGDPTLLFDDARALKPAIMYLVPRIGNRLVQTLKSTFLKTPEQVAAWEQSYAAKRRVLLSGTLPRDEKLDDSMGLMKAMRDYVGGRLRMSASGAAPAPAANLEFHRIVFGIRLFERFGQTESTSAFATTNFSDLWNPYGSHVGTATRQSEFKLVARPEMGYNVTEGNNWVGSKGEAACRGTVVFRGYYLQKEKTEEALVDGWLLTGDVVELLPDGTLKVIDRVKNVFKLSRGEFVAPERVEVAYARSKYVLQCYVDGYREQPSLVAIIVPDPEQIGAFAMKAGIPGDYAQLVKDHRVTAEVFSDLQRIAKEDGLPFYEQAAAITLSDCVFTVENNLLTPTIKNRRPQLRERFRKEFEEMYARLGRESEERAKGGAKL